METFNNSAVWGGPSGTNATGAQVWFMQMAPPTITAQPQSINTNIGANVSFSVTATGVAPLDYQWRLNATNIVNASDATLGLNNVQTNNAGGYDVIVGNAVGSVTSLVATLSVSPVINTNLPPPAGTVGTTYSQMLTAGGGAPPYTWVLIGGGLPDGLALSSGGQISGTPTTVGAFNFTVQITAAVEQVTTGTFCLAIADPWFQIVGNSIVPLGDGFGAGGVMNTNNTMIQSLNAYNGFLYACVETVSNPRQSGAAATC